MAQWKIGPEFRPHHHKKQQKVVHACNPGSHEEGTGVSLGLTDQSHNLNYEFQFG